jgi:hypothetical protein
LLICDDVLVSQGKGKHFIQGVIGTIVARSFPAVIGGYVAYVRLSNVYPKAKLRIALVSADSDDEIFAFDVQADEKADPLGVVTLIIPIPPFTIDHPGRYIFCGKHDGVPFATTPISIIAPTQPPEE